MTRFRGVLALLAVAAMLGSGEAPRAQLQSLVIRNVTLIDGTGSAPQAGMTVVVSGNRIGAVGKSPAVPPGAQVVDGTGKFLIPGFWDMHVHPRGLVSIPKFNTYGDVLLLTNGITGQRIMAGLPEFRRIQRAILSGESFGPRIEFGSRNFDGKIPRQPLPPKFGDTGGEKEEWQSVNSGEIPRAYQVTTEAEAKTAVADAKAMGIEYVKIHNELTPEAYFAISKEARAAGLYLTGHVPTGVSVSVLSDTGMRSIEHWGGMLEGCSSREDDLLKAELAVLDLPAPERAKRNAEIRRMALDSYSAAKCAELASRFVKQGTWLSPTFMPPAGGARAQSERQADLVKYIPNPLRGRWLQQAAAAAEPTPPSAEDQALARAVQARNRDIVLVMKRAGVQFVPGTDSGGPWRIPGRSLHESLVEMFNAGLTPTELISSASLNSARLMKREKDVGTVQAGKFADMMLVDANPAQDITNARRISAVVANGRLMDRKALDDLLAQLAATNGTN